MRTLVLSLGTLAFFASDLPSQWGSRGCGPVGSVRASSPVFVQPAREWRQLANDPGRWHLFVNGKQAGAYCPTENIYRACDAVRWHAPSEPPADLPQAAKAKASGCGCKGGACKCETGCCGCRSNGVCSVGCSCTDFSADLPAFAPPIGHDAPNHGLCPEWLGNRGPEVIYHGSQKVTLNEALQSIESVPDYRAKPQATIWAKGDVGKATMEQVKAAGIQDAFYWTVRDPDHWHAKDRDGQRAFRTDGNPSIYIQAPNGKPLHSSHRPLTGVEMAALRKADPNYSPDKDPDVTKPKPAPSPGPSPQLPDWFKQVPPWAWVLGAGIGLVLFVNLRNQPKG